MNILDETLKENDLDYIIKNDEIFEKVLSEIARKLGMAFTYTKDYNPQSRFFYLKNERIYDSNNVDWFFEILKKYNYNMKNEIQDAMVKLGMLKNPKENKILIKQLLGSPYIQDISFDEKGKFTNESDEFGKFIFYLATYFYKDSVIVENYLSTQKLPQRCHEHTYFLSKIFGDSYSITSLCPNYFEGTYYHSYTYDDDSNVITDFCFNAVIDKDLYDKMFEPKELSVILNKKVNEELKLTEEKTNQISRRCQLLKIVLYKQYLQSINYHGPLEKAPSIKTL